VKRSKYYYILPRYLGILLPPGKEALVKLFLYVKTEGMQKATRVTYGE
jgi:hypothetical protein